MVTNKSPEPLAVSRPVEALESEGRVRILEARPPRHRESTMAGGGA